MHSCLQHLHPLWHHTTRQQHGTCVACPRLHPTSVSTLTARCCVLTAPLNLCCLDTWEPPSQPTTQLSEVHYWLRSPGLQDLPCSTHLGCMAVFHRRSSAPVALPHAGPSPHPRLCHTQLWPGCLCCSVLAQSPCSQAGRWPCHEQQQLTAGLRHQQHQWPVAAAEDSIAESLDRPCDVSDVQTQAIVAIPAPEIALQGYKADVLVSGTHVKCGGVRSAHRRGVCPHTPSCPDTMHRAVVACMSFEITVLTPLAHLVGINVLLQRGLCCSNDSSCHRLRCGTRLV